MTNEQEKLQDLCYDEGEVVFLFFCAGEGGDGLGDVGTRVAAESVSLLRMRFFSRSMEN